MAYPVEHYLLAFGGPLGSGEQWTNTLRLHAPTYDATQDAETATVADLAAFFKAHWVTVNPISGGARLGWLKYNRVGTDGKYMNPWTTVYDFSPLVVSSAAIKHPHQVSLVATLTTDAARGLASKGRIYLPSPMYSVAGADATIASGDAASAANWVAGLVNGINGVAGAGNVHVISRGARQDDGSWGPGAMRPVMGVSVGNVYDTMRSRRGKVVEQRTDVAVTTFGDFGGPF